MNIKITNPKTSIYHVVINNDYLSPIGIGFTRHEALVAALTNVMKLADEIIELKNHAITS